MHSNSKGPSSPRSSKKGAAYNNVRIGPAGWSYPDWSGYVYPSPKPKGFHEAAYLSQFFDPIEINTFFFRPLNPETSSQLLEWVSSIPAAPLHSKPCRRFTRVA